MIYTVLGCILFILYTTTGELSLLIMAIGFSLAGVINAYKE